MVQELLVAYEDTFQDASGSIRLGKSKGAARREDVRMCIAHVMRLTILGLPRGFLAAHEPVTGCYRDFLNVTLKHVPPAVTSPADAYWENQVRVWGQGGVRRS